MNRFLPSISMLVTLLWWITGCGSAQAGAVADSPSGFVTISCLGSSDTVVSMPVTRTPVYVGSGTMAVITSGSVGMVTFSGASFTTSAYKYDSSSQTNTYYLFVASGSKAGSYYTITDNSTATVTVDLNGDDVSAMTSGTTMKIIPYWTLGTVFPSGSGVTATTGFTVATQVIIPNTSDAGINLASSAVYYYSSSTAHWVKSGSTTSQDDVILYPDNYFTVRNNTSTTTTLTATGNLITTQLMVPLSTRTGGKQDNYVAVGRPVTVTLADSGLISSGAFKSSSSFAITDRLLVFDNTTAKLNKAASTVYYYVNGWRKSGSTGTFGSDEVFTPGTGVIIRKAKTSAGASVIWTNPVPFTY